MRRLALCGYYGAGNGGDEALLATLLQLLPADTEPVVLSGHPAHTERLHGVAAIPKMSLQAVPSTLRRCDGLVLGGGSLFQDASSWRNPFYYAGVVAIARTLGLPVWAWAQGVGPLARPWARGAARLALAQCDRRSVRDRDSWQQLQNWGLEARVAPDPVWALAAEPFPRDWPRPCVAVVLRSHRLLTSAWQEAIVQALRLWQAAEGLHVLWVPFQPPTDGMLATQLQAQVPGSTIQTCAHPRQLKGLFAQVDMAIAMRLHGVIMALAEGTPCWPLSYDPKVTVLARELHLTAGYLQEAPPPPATLVRVWQACYRTPAPDVTTQQQGAIAHQEVLR
ncbi:MAG TPA: polysaccharide pyruvyl transferase CsaB [Cyanobacteria bacterium UBA8156]|jgi:polysaccharide pyruvyl transferase CsaB|nr:polysaccharide pyruvyl transferase CsaB [Cyanobacteria bacterium UBA8156]